MYRQQKSHGGRSVYNSKNHTKRDRGPKKNGHQQYINPNLFIKPAVAAAEQEAYEPKHQFADFEIHPLIKQNIAQKGYIIPSPIQDQAIPQGLAGRDIVGIANTGTGKTAAFVIPLLDRLSRELRSNALIIAPTRELAQQIEEEFRSFAKGSGLRSSLLIGGTSMYRQTHELRANPSVVIGTPGRIKDHTQKNNLDLGRFNIIVLDEVDRMVDMGFITDIRFLLGKLNPNHQSYFFSATLDPKLKTLVETFLHDPVTISVKTSESSDFVQQDVLSYGSDSDKIDKLHDTLIRDSAIKALIFDQTQRSVEKLSKELQARGFKADAIHGGKTQGARQRALARFKQNEINILVATDVAARGIDVIDITHVINYTRPNTYDDYIHRIGRAGRAGRKGHALTFVNQ